MIKELIEGQLILLKEELGEADPDPELIAEQAETILMYARVLRDFPELPEALRTRYPEPPTGFRSAFSMDISTIASEER